MVQGLLLAVIVSAVMNLFLILFQKAAAILLKLTPVERCSIVYPNAGNLIVPLVTAMFGKEWVIYSSAFMAVQQFLIWSHGKNVICKDRGISIRKILTNPNMIAVFAGVLLLVCRISLPDILNDSIESVSMLVGPISMLITGMLIGSMSFRKLFSFARVWLVLFLRLLAAPAFILIFLYLLKPYALHPQGITIICISFLACTSPSAATVVQLAQLYGNDAEYASAINVFSTLACILTMPAMIWLYSSLIG